MWKLLLAAILATSLILSQGARIKHKYVVRRSVESNSDSNSSSGSSEQSSEESREWNYETQCTCPDLEDLKGEIEEPTDSDTDEENYGGIEQEDGEEEYEYEKPGDENEYINKEKSDSTEEEPYSIEKPETTEKKPDSIEEKPDNSKEPGDSGDDDTCTCDIEKSQEEIKTECPEEYQNVKDGMIKAFPGYLNALVEMHPNESVVLSHGAVQYVLSIFLKFSKKGSETMKELKKITNFEDIDQVSCALQTLNEALYTVEGKFISTDNIYADNQYPFEPKFQVKVATLTSGEAKNLPYEYPGRSAEIVNDMVANVTYNDIKDIITNNLIFKKKDSLGVVIGATNNVDWLYELEPTDEVTEFKTQSSETEKSQFLTNIAKYDYAEVEQLDAKVIRLDKTSSLDKSIYILPNKDDGLPTLLKKLQTLTVEQYYDILKSLKPTLVKVILPECDILTTSNVKKILIELGVTTLFTPEISVEGVLVDDPTVPVGFAVQKARSQLRKDGGPAPKVDESNENIKIFKADHPFVFLLTLDDAPIICGVVANSTVNYH